MNNMRKQVDQLAHKISLCIILWALIACSEVWAVPLPESSQCQIIFSLKGDSQTVFEHQVQQLAHHIDSLDIALIDLNRTHNEKTYTNISGRLKRRLKRKLELIGNKSVAIVRLNQVTLLHVSGGIDLTLLIQTCQKGLA
jgi:hypothetical protein